MKSNREAAAAGELYEDALHPEQPRAPVIEMMAARVRAMLDERPEVTPADVSSAERVQVRQFGFELYDDD